MRFIDSPFMPTQKVKTIAVDYRVDMSIADTLKEWNIDVVKTVPCMDLYEAINGHPDIVMHPTGQNRIVLAPNIFDELAPVLEKKGFALTKGATWLTRNYPGNIAYNVLRVGPIAFHHTKYTDQKILEQFEQQNIKLVHINQGYSKCSTCIVNEKTIITSDKKLAVLAERNDIESLLIKPEQIALPGLSHGFIGGATGLLSEKILAFSGNFEELEDKHRIEAFLNKKGIEVKLLSHKKIIDYGSLIPLNC